MNFTPGPWKVCGMSGGWTGVKPIAHKLEICKLVENNEANADLIAAAPEMYEALRKMAGDDAFADLCAGIGEEPDWLKEARAALAKAKGGQS